MPSWRADGRTFNGWVAHNKIHVKNWKRKNPERARQHQRDMRKRRREIYGADFDHNTLARLKWAMARNNKVDSIKTLKKRKSKPLKVARRIVRKKRPK